MKVYRGYRVFQRGLDGEPVSCECRVEVELVSGRKRPLNLRLDIRNHSPTGFEWGYGGSGPAQLALALVADACGRKLAVPRVYQVVKRVIVSGLPRDGWVLYQDEIKRIVKRIFGEEW